MGNRLPQAALLFFLSFPVWAQTRGEGFSAPFTAENFVNEEAASLYAEWAQKAIDEGRWTEALNGLERAKDFGGVSSDIFYLLAAARNHFERPAGSVLEALEKALEAGIWRGYSAADANLLKAALLIKLKRYGEAIPVISSLPENPASLELKLRALRFLPSHAEFRKLMSYTLARYPKETGPVRIFLDFLRSERGAGRSPRENDEALLELILKRLPVLKLIDPELAWMAVPFMLDAAEARRLVESYRAVNRPDPLSLPAALNLGVIDEETAIEELLGGDKREGVDRAIVEEISALLRDAPRRELFVRNLSRWSGVLKEDSGGDGFFEAKALYETGRLVFYSLDLNQDGLSDLSVEFEAGDPKSAAVKALPGAFDKRPPYPQAEEDESKILIEWESFPKVKTARLGEEKFSFRPLEYNYAPVEFHLVAGGGLLFPELLTAAFTLGRRSLVLNCIELERPSAEFPGAFETVFLNRGIPLSSLEKLDGRLVSETGFLRGKPVEQRADLDFDGRLETLRRFRRAPSVAENHEEPAWNLVDYLREFEYADSDWDGDGIFETRQY